MLVDPCQYRSLLCSPLNDAALQVRSVTHAVSVNTFTDLDDIDAAEQALEELFDEMERLEDLLAKARCRCSARERTTTHSPRSLRSPGSPGGPTSR